MPSQLRILRTQFHLRSVTQLPPGWGLRRDVQRRSAAEETLPGAVQAKKQSADLSFLHRGAAFTVQPNPVGASAWAALDAMIAGADCMEAKQENAIPCRFCSNSARHCTLLLPTFLRAPLWIRRSTMHWRAGRKCARISLTSRSR